MVRTQAEIAKFSRKDVDPAASVEPLAERMLERWLMGALIQDARYLAIADAAIGTISVPRRPRARH
jgi:hypothetical protein